MADPCNRTGGLTKKQEKDTGRYIGEVVTASN